MSETFIKIDSLQHLVISRETYPTKRSKIPATTFTVLTIVQFREFAMTAELKKWKRILYRLSLHLKQYIHKFQREKDLFITLSIEYIQISNTYLPEFLNILLYVEANPV